MIDKNVLEKGLAALSVAAGELLEDNQDELVMALPKAKAQRQARFKRLAVLATDLRTLAEAAAVLARRGN